MHLIVAQATAATPTFGSRLAGISHSGSEQALLPSLHLHFWLPLLYLGLCPHLLQVSGADFPAAKDLSLSRILTGYFVYLTADTCPIPWPTHVAESR